VLTGAVLMRATALPVLGFTALALLAIPVALLVTSAPRVAAGRQG
jgi:hypothetical protein